MILLYRFITSRFLKKWGSSALKKRIWDKEFASGHWNYIDSTTDDVIYRYIEKWSSNGIILDVGCGAGNTGTELDSNKYVKYMGVDISQFAIDRSRHRSQEMNRAHKNSYACGDMVTYILNESYDLILFRESIFYVSNERVHSLLQRYKRYLSNNGRFLVSICETKKHKYIINMILNNYNIIDSYYNNNRGIILVFN